MANKITKREVINMMLAEESISANETFKAYLEHELELLDKKAENKKATKNQEENVGYMATILEVLGKAEKAMTVTEIMKSDETLSELSNQRVSALLSKLKDELKVVRTTEGRKAVFSLAE
jgi:hypothetical protein